MFTTIKISKELRDKLERMKMSEGETYESVIDDLMEDHLDLNPEFRKKLESRMNDAKAGKFVSFSEVKRKYSRD
jgi:predicted transcriptional regulator